MGNLTVRSMVVGEVGTNCYFAVHKETKELILIDPGDGASRIATTIEKEGYHPKAVLLTHAHYDHVLAVDALSERYGIPVYAHEAEKETVEDPHLNLGGISTICRVTDYVKDGEELSLAGFRILVLFTPGHTPGGCCFYFPEEKALFSGDTLFEGSVGRTDFPKGNMRQLVDGIREKLLVLPEETVVFPGHMGMTSIGQEKKYNMYLS